MGHEATVLLLEAPNGPDVGDLVDLPVSLLVADNYAGRDAIGDPVRDLAVAIEAAGRVNVPVDAWARTDGRYVVKNGHHRTAAVALLGWATIPVRIVARPVDAAAYRLEQVADNDTHRAPSDLERAAAYGAAVDAGLSVEVVAAQCGKRPSFVRRRLELLKIAEDVRPVILSRGITFGEAVADLPHGAQRAAARELGPDVTPARWSAICQRARELEAERAAASMFDAGAFELTPETWSTELGAYVETLEAADVADAAPVLVRDVPLGVREIADRLGVKADTVAKWRARPSVAFPAPALEISGVPAWWTSDVDAWAASTGRAK